MLPHAIEPRIRPNMGTRPMALLALAFGVAIGGSLAGAPSPAIERPALVSAVQRPAAVSGVDVDVRKPVRVIPLPVRDVRYGRTER
ncbi:hypothetical protein GCM10007887_19040 [Methylobacterium haplocladii]|uniref:Uncharacterized protein n=1 Tax=Methylobacterium haplocladii TaxID=1176176 RepID=A0A512ILK1_9HYPH|nr:hypothetical protein MHA02_09840 [Methylobacterium haplocladii]GJD84004.1 hypothetical protein HPGCJGGD_1879 [Methylobacterium haplocladii]GLS59238.1 hypothetical protein GCM10007887_19040 [Methylobacterium haplocladii]